MVPEDQQEEPALTASDPSVPSTPTVEPGAAESAEGAIVGGTINKWADLSDAAPVPTAGLEEQDLLDTGHEPLDSGELVSAGGAAFGTPGEEAPDTEEFQPRFDAFSLLEHQQEEEHEPSAEELFDLFQSDPTEEHPVGAEPPLAKSVPIAAETDNPEDKNAS